MANYHEQIAAMRAERARRERNSQLEEILQNWQEAVQARDQAAREVLSPTTTGRSASNKTRGAKRVVAIDCVVTATVQMIRATGKCLNPALRRS
jgi:hypothetical protein